MKVKVTIVKDLVTLCENKLRKTKENKQGTHVLQSQKNLLISQEHVYIDFGTAFADLT